MEMVPYTFVLGGTSGLGAAIADECERRQEQVLRVGRKIIDLSRDQGIHDQLEEMGRDQIQDHVACDKLYWCAGILHRGDFVEQSIHEMLCVNLVNALEFVQFIWWQQRKVHERPFHLITIASTTGISDSPRADEAVYAATKAAQVSFTRAIGKGNTNPNLKVSLFCPGGMKTPFWDNMPDVDTSSFLDPRKVAEAIVNDVSNQTEFYFERTIPRGSL
jgi:short-subunit dehydrogenase